MSIRRSLALAAFALLVAPTGRVEAQGRTLDSPVNTKWTKRSPTSIFGALSNASDTIVWVLPNAAVPTNRMDFDGRGKTVREVLDSITKQLGLKWKADGRLVLIFAQAADDPLRGKLGEAKVQGRSLSAWRVELCSQRRRARPAARALRQGGEPGVRVLIQAAINGPSFARWAAGDEVKLAGKAAAKLVLEQLEVAGPREKYTLAEILRKIPAGGALLVKRLTKGTLAQRQATLELLLALRTLPTGFGKGVVALLDDPQLTPRERQKLARDVSRALRYTTDAALNEAALVWKKLLTSSDPRVRREASYGVSDLISRVTRSRSIDPKRRDTILDDLSKVLIPALDDPELGSYAARSLGLIARTRAPVMTLLEKRLQTETDPRTRLALVEGLSASRDPKVVPALLKVLASDPGRLARRISSALSSMGAAARPALIAALKDPAAVVRRVACEALASSARRRRGSSEKDTRAELVGHLNPLIQDSDGEVRRAALKTIARCGKAGHESLLAALGHADAAVRLAAVMAVSSGGKELGKAALPRLLKCLAAEDSEIKIAAALALRRQGKDAASAGPALVKLLEDLNEKVQGAAASALSTVPCDAAKAVPALVSMLASRDNSARYNALGALRKFGPKKAALGIDAMVKLVTSPDLQVQRAGLEAMALVAPVKNEKALEAVIEAAQSQSSNLRGLAAVALVSLAPSSQQAQDMLFVLVEDEQSSVRRAACTAYAKLTTIPKDHREALFASAQEMLAGRDYGLKRSAVTLLGRLAADDPRALKTLVEMLDGRGRGSSYEIERALADLGPRALPLLLKLIEANPNSRAVNVLRRLKTVDKSAVPALIKLLGSGSSNARRVGASLLVKLKGDAAPALNALVKALEDRDYSVRSSALQALGNIGAPAVVPLAKRLLDPKARQDRYQVARVLAKMGPKAAPAIPHLIKGLGERSSFMTDACVSALAKIGKASQGPLLKALDDPSRRVQANAARALAMIKPPAVDVFERLLKIAGTRRFSSYNLGKMALGLGDKALPILRKAIKDSNLPLTERLGAIECAGRLGPKARPLLKDMLPLLSQSRLSYQVRRVLRSIGAGKAEMPMVREALGSPDRATREGAVVVLGGAGKVAIPLLKEILNGPPELRSRAVTAAEALGKDAAPLVPELIEALKDRGTRWTAERALTKIKAPAVGPLISSLNHTEAGVRESAARALLKMGPKATALAKAPLQALLQQEPERVVRLQAALALGPLGGDPTVCVPILLRDWESGENDSVKSQLAKAIVAFGPKAASEFADRLLKDLDYDGLAVRKRAIDSIGRIASQLSDTTLKAAVPKLMAIARDDPSLNIQMSAIMTLSTCGRHAQPALPVLRKLQTHSNRRVSQQAGYAVQRIERAARYPRRRRPRRVR